ncbi:MAG: PocR ligand-binding domain-containing protein [Deltaproteobacteria bacterium]|jgi:ligand-binding sensor protein|nr:PocR ligand-binding domain-containing protein [Deltaproteobacteria bacterium]
MSSDLDDSLNRPAGKPSDRNPNGALDEDTIVHFNIPRLFGKSNLEKIQSVVSKATGLALVTVDYKGEPITELTSFTPFCQEMHDEQDTGKLCRQAYVYGAGQALASQDKCVYFCPCGLLEVAVPIIVKNIHLGSFYGGQVRCENAPKEIANLSRLFEADLAKCPLNARQKKKYKNIPVYDYERFLDLSELLALVVRQNCQACLTDQSWPPTSRMEVKSLRDTAARLENELAIKQSELISIKSRMNFHFLINSLSSMANLALIEESPRTSEMVSLLADHLKQSLVGYKFVVFLAEELNYVERYLKMQKIRYGNLLNYHIEVAQELTMRKIPTQIIGPLVERAVFYGLSTVEAPLTVTVTVEQKGADLLIKVIDNGSGLSEEELTARFAAFQNDYEGESILMSINELKHRLDRLFVNNYSIEINSVPGHGTESQVHIPMRLPAGVF